MKATRTSSNNTKRKRVRVSNNAYTTLFPSIRRELDMSVCVCLCCVCLCVCVCVCVCACVCCMYVCVCVCVLFSN